MKRIKLITVMLALGWMPFALNAQTKTEKWATLRTDSLKTELSLNDSQYKSVYDIVLNFSNKVVEVKEQTASKAEKFNQLKKLEEQKDAALKAVLSEEQFEKYMVAKKEERQEMKEQYKANQAKGKK